MTNGASALVSRPPHRQTMSSSMNRENWNLHDEDLEFSTRDSCISLTQAVSAACVSWAEMVCAQLQSCFLLLCIHILAHFITIAVTHNNHFLELKSSQQITLPVLTWLVSLVGTRSMCKHLGFFSSSSHSSHWIIFTIR